ncbi:unnamed protein product, partial [Prorocentrum cordatum]
MPAKIMVIRDIERDDIEFISKILGVEASASMDTFTPEKLAKVSLVQDQKLNDDLGSIVRFTGLLSSHGGCVSVLVRASNQMLLDETERSIHDALCVVRSLVKKRYLIPGGGAPEMEVSQKLLQWARTIGGIEAVCIEHYAEAFGGFGWHAGGVFSTTVYAAPLARLTVAGFASVSCAVGRYTLEARKACGRIRAMLRRVAQALIKARAGQAVARKLKNGGPPVYSTGLADNDGDEEVTVNFEDGDFYTIPGMTHKRGKDMMSVKQQKKGNYLWEGASGAMAEEAPPEGRALADGEVAPEGSQTQQESQHQGFLTLADVPPDMLEEHVRASQNMAMEMDDFAMAQRIQEEEEQEKEKVVLEVEDSPEKPKDGEAPSDGHQPSPVVAPIGWIQAKRKANAREGCCGDAAFGRDGGSSDDGAEIHDSTHGQRGPEPYGHGQRSPDPCGSWKEVPQELAGHGGETNPGIERPIVADVQPQLEGHAPNDKESLLTELHQELDAMNQDVLFKGTEEQSMERMSQVLTQFFNGDLVGKVQKLRKEDAKAAKEIEKDDPLPEDAARDKALFEELALNNYYFTTQTTAGNAIGSRWARAIAASDKLRRNYAKCQGWAESRDFRAKWCKKLHKKHKARWEKRKEETFEKTEMKDGKYISLGRMAFLEGGGSAGLKAAFKYATNAILVGGMYVKWDEWTESVKFLYLTHRLRESFKRAWSTFQSWQGKGDIEDAQLPANEDDDDDASTKVKKDKTKQKTKTGKDTGGGRKSKGTKGERKGKGTKGGNKGAKGKKGAKGDKGTKGGKRTGRNGTEDGTNGDQKKKMTSTPPWPKEFKQVKSMFDTCSLQYMRIHEKVKKDPQWQWAKKSGTEDLDKANAKVGEAKFQLRAKRATQVLTDPLIKLQKECNTMEDMTAAKDSAVLCHYFQKCEAPGYCSVHSLLKVAAWQLQCLVDGTLPDHGHDGVEMGGKNFDPGPRKFPFKSMVMYIKGDWSEYQHSMGLMPWGPIYNCCPLCTVTKDLRDVAYPGMVTKDGLEHRDRKHHEYCEACSRREHVVNVANDRIRDALADILHDDGNGKGRVLKKDVDLPALKLKRGDRLEPSDELLTPELGNGIGETDALAGKNQTPWGIYRRNRAPLTDGASRSPKDDAQLTEAERKNNGATSSNSKGERKSARAPEGEAEGKGKLGEDELQELRARLACAEDAAGEAEGAVRRLEAERAAGPQQSGDVRSLARFLSRRFRRPGRVPGPQGPAARRGRRSGGRRGRRRGRQAAAAAGVRGAAGEARLGGARGGGRAPGGAPGAGGRGAPASRGRRAAGAGGGAAERGRARAGG